MLGVAEARRRLAQQQAARQRRGGRRSSGRCGSSDPARPARPEARRGRQLRRRTGGGAAADSEDWSLRPAGQAHPAESLAGKERDAGQALLAGSKAVEATVSRIGRAVDQVIPL